MEMLTAVVDEPDDWTGLFVATMCVRTGRKEWMDGVKMCGGDGLDYSASLFGMTDLYESVESNASISVIK
jgi:hypothetical protein